MNQRARRRDQEKEKFWRKKIAEWKRSGSPIAEFCRTHDLKQTGFYWWRRELRRREEVRKENERGKAKGSFSLPTFTPVRVVHSKSSVKGGQQETDLGAGVEIILAGRRLVRVYRGFDPDVLLQVIETLESAAC